jgi:hypothetical protein
MLRRRTQRRRLKRARNYRKKVVRLELRARLEQRKLIRRFRKASAAIRFLYLRRVRRQRRRFKLRATKNRRVKCLTRMLRRR